MGSVATLGPPKPWPRRPEPAGECRVCGCTDHEACIVWTSEIPGTTTGMCSWVERDLCSRCHGPHRPTRAQENELDRIRRRVGPYELTAGRYPGELVVTLLELGPMWKNGWQARRELRMSPTGWVTDQRARGDEIAREKRRASAALIAGAERDLEL